MDFNSFTEQPSAYQHLEHQSVADLAHIFNKEDQTVAASLTSVLPQIISLVEKIVSQLKNGGRLFYIGAGTSGRLGVLDASECPPTFGVSPDLVIGLIAGGDQALRKSIERAEDDLFQGWKDLEQYSITKKDIVIGIAASGTTPYVVHALKACKDAQIPTGCITCNPKSPLAITAEFPIEVVVGPEIVSGSSRLKAGTAQKMILNMLSTITMIQMGRIKGNRMVDMQLNNDKLHHRAIKIIQDEVMITKEKAEKLLIRFGSVRKVLNALKDE